MMKKALKTDMMKKKAMKAMKAQKKAKANVQKKAMKAKAKGRAVGAPRQEGWGGRAVAALICRAMPCTGVFSAWDYYCMDCLACNGPLKNAGVVYLSPHRTPPPGGDPVCIVINLLVAVFCPCPPLCPRGCASGGFAPVVVPMSASLPLILGFESRLGDHEAELRVVNTRLHALETQEP